MATSARPGLRSSSARRIPKPPDSKTALPTVEDVAAPPAIAVAGGELALLAEVITACTACPRASERRALGSGYVRAPVLFVKDEPSIEDLDATCAFTGEAEALERAMAGLGLPAGWMYGSTAVRCGTGSAGSDDVRTCSRHLLVEVEAIGPRVIVACGEGALQAVRSLDGRCGIAVPDEIERGVSMSLRTGLDLVWTEALPAGVTEPDAKRRLWKDLQVLPRLLGRG